MLIRSDGFVRGRKAVRAAPTPIVKKHLLYEIEKVIKSRQGEWGREYLVKWRGYGSDDNMWIDKLPSFFKKNSSFYEASLSDEDDPVESDSVSEDSADSGSGSVGDEVVTSEDEAVSSEDEVGSDADEPDSDDSGEDYTETTGQKKRKRVCTRHHKSTRRSARKLIFDDSDSDDELVELPSVVALSKSVVQKPKAVAQKPKGVNNHPSAYGAAFEYLESESEESAVHPPKACAQSKSGTPKSKGSKKEQLAMRALLALAEYVNDTESDDN